MVPETRSDRLWGTGRMPRRFSPGIEWTLLHAGGARQAAMDEYHRTGKWLSKVLLLQAV
jgi:hypothetical protein